MVADIKTDCDACSDMSGFESPTGDENRTATFGELGDLMKELNKQKSSVSKKNRRTTASPGALEKLLREITQDTDNENMVRCTKMYNITCPRYFTLFYFHAGHKC